MAEETRNQYVPDYVSPPGETLLETLDAIGMSQAELAERTGHSKKMVNEIIKGKAAITAETALQLERVLGIPAAFWNNRDRQYREALAERQERQRLQRRVPWLDRFPVRHMAKLGWINASPDKPRQLREVLNFFGVASPAQWEELWGGRQVAFRKSPVFRSEPQAVAAWLRRGEVLSQAIQCELYDQDRFRSALLKVRRLTVDPPEVFEPRLTEWCSQCGVAVVFVRELPKAPVSGATRWLSAHKALVQLSLRYKTDDHLWFSFFHEAAHILLHGKRQVFVEDDSVDDVHERAANAFAADILIPQAQLDHFLRRHHRISKTAIRKFAAGVGVAPGIVVGRLQHDDLLDFSWCNDLKRRFVWAHK